MAKIWEKIFEKAKDAPLAKISAQSSEQGRLISDLPICIPNDIHCHPRKLQYDGGKGAKRCNASSRKLTFFACEANQESVAENGKCIGSS
tara:strand:- start:119 stop:388 length:270 start_codon:yes stop_codon:yes gene_type:complete